MATPEEPGLMSSFRTFWDARIEWPPDMPDDMLEAAINSAKEAMKKHDIEKEGQDIAKAIKAEFDEKWQPYWHVVIGKNFGTQCTHETRRYVHFYLGKWAFLIYKMGF